MQKISNLINFMQQLHLELGTIIAIALACSAAQNEDSTSSSEPIIKINISSITEKLYPHELARNTTTELKELKNSCTTKTMLDNPAIKILLKQLQAKTQAIAELINQPTRGYKKNTASKGNEDLLSLINEIINSYNKEIAAPNQHNMLQQDKPHHKETGKTNIDPEKVENSMLESFNTINIEEISDKISQELLKSMDGLGDNAGCMAPEAPLTQKRSHRLFVEDPASKKA